MLLEQAGSAGFGKRARVVKLMVVGRGRIRKEHGGQAHGRQLGEGRRARPADGSGGGAEHQFHFVKKRMHHGAEVELRISLRDFLLVVGPSEMKPLHFGRQLGEQRQSLDH